MHFMLMLARCFFVSTEIFMWVSHARNTLIGPRTHSQDISFVMLLQVVIWSLTTCLTYNIF